MKTTQGTAQGYVDNPYAPSLYSEEAAGFFIINGVVHVTFANIQADHSPNKTPLRKVVNLRLSMPVAGAQSLALGLYDFLKSQGHDPAPMSKDEQIQ